MRADARRVLLLVFATSVSPGLAVTQQQDGLVKSGGAPVVGATVTLYAAGPSRGAGATVLGSATSGPGGSFNIIYGAPAENAVLYLMADGPEVGMRLASVLGGAPGPNVVVINERTTVATAYAMAQFIEDGIIGGKSPGVANAAAILRNLVDIQTGNVGHSLATPPNGSRTSTLATFNSLANMLAACAGDPVVRALLFALATPPGAGPEPDDTLEAMVNIAHFPGHNSAALFAFSSLANRYSPARSEAPVAWTLALNYTGNGREFDGPGAIVFDAGGNAWINNNYTFRNNHSVTSCGGELLHKLTPAGEDFPGAPYTGGGLSGAGFGITLDLFGNVWIGNFGFYGSTCPMSQWPAANSISKFTPEGTAISPSTGYTAGPLLGPQGTVCDLQNNIWVASTCNGTVVQYLGETAVPNWVFDVNAYFGVGNAKPFDVAIDSQGNGWVSDNRNDRVFKLAPNGALVAMSPANAGIQAPMGVAIDSLDNVWISNSGIVDPPCTGNAGSQGPGLGALVPDPVGASVGLLGPDGVPHPGQPFQSGGVFLPWGIAVDGNDNVWVANFARQAVAHVRGANPATWPQGYATGDPISPPVAGYHFDGLMRNTGVSIDPSGNVWLTNNWLLDVQLTNPGGDGVVVFIGLAGPVKTPSIGPPQQP